MRHAALVTLVLILGCGDDEEDPPDASPVSCDKLDILFVVDNSGSMQEEQMMLAAQFPDLVAEIQALPGGQPDLHIGVVTSDMGTLGQNVTGCMGAGDNGVLQNTPGVVGCTAPTDRFIADDGNGTTNYTGTLAEAFSCIVQVGDDGCGYEQHLAALRAALDPARSENASFLRADAALLVVILADEDDCSASDPMLFDPNQDSNTSELGFSTSFRCTEFGVTCNPALARAPGEHDQCVPRTDSYLEDPGAIATFLKGLKGDQAVMMAVIAGPPEPVAVALETDTRRCGDATTPCVPTLTPSCVSVNGSAAPAVRLASFATEFTYNHTASICGEFILAEVREMVLETCTDD